MRRVHEPEVRSVVPSRQGTTPSYHAASVEIDNKRSFYSHFSIERVVSIVVLSSSKSSARFHTAFGAVANNRAYSALATGIA